jgi:signal transduction histidine kinase
MLRGFTATGALLLVALGLAGAVAWQAHRAARAHRAAADRLLRDHAAYAAAEFARRAAATLEAGFVTLQHFPADALEGRPASVPLPSVAAYRAAVRAQDHWCNCLQEARGFFRVDLADGALESAEGGMDAATRAWVGGEARARAAALAADPRTAQVAAFDEIEGRTRRNLYQMRIQRTAVRLRRGEGGAPRAMLFTVVSDDRGRPRAAYGLVDDPRVFAGPVFRRIAGRVPLLPATVARGAPNDSLLAVDVMLAGAPLFRAGTADGGSVTATEAFPGEFSALAARVTLRRDAAARLVEGGLPASPLPLLLGLLAVTAGVVAVAFVQLRRHHALARLRTEFVAGVSHELRTPLTQIRMFSELLVGGRLRDDEERDRSLRLIDREARRLAYLVDNALAFTRGERAAPELRLRPADVAAAVAEVADGFEPVARGRGAVLRLASPPPGAATAALDRDAFRQVLLNLLDNAVKYGPAGQTVRVETAVRGGSVVVSVRDEGPGVPPADRERVWEPFVRLRREIDGVVGGSGIGLAVVRDLVARHGGRVAVEAPEGGGARVVVELPLVSPGPGREAGGDGASRVSPGSSDPDASRLRATDTTRSDGIERTAPGIDVRGHTASDGMPEESGRGEMRDGRSPQEELRGGEMRDVEPSRAMRDGQLRNHVGSRSEMRDLGTRDGEPRPGEMRDREMRNGEMRDREMRNGEMRDGEMGDGGAGEAA